MQYEAFISYSHANDRLLAKSLQRVIQSLGKPWYLVRTVRVFRDETSLTATPELWPTIVDALKNSRFLLLIASREAAKSNWVSREVEWWLANKCTKTLLIILSEGNLRWDDSLGDFEKSSSDALPPILFNRFQNEPLWIDLRNWRCTNKDVSDDVHFKGLASKIAARLKNIPPEDLWSQELTQQRRNLRMAGFSVAILLTLLFFSLWQTYFAMNKAAIAQLSNMEASVRLGSYPLTFANAVALKRPYLLTDAQIQKGENLLYEALWSNRLVKTIQLKNKYTLQFEEDTERLIIKQLEDGVGHPITRPIQSMKADIDIFDIAQYTPPRHWQTPQGFGAWSNDRRQIRIDLPSAGDSDTTSSITVTLNKCLENGDDEYRIEKPSSKSGDHHLFSAKELLGNTSKAVAARKDLIAPIYYVKDHSEIEYLLVEISSVAPTDNDLNQEVLCVISIAPQKASIIDIYNPNLTLGMSDRIDNVFGLHRIAPNARYYLEMKSGDSLTIREASNLSEGKTLLDKLSFLPYSNDIDQRIAFSKDGNSYIVSGYHREGSWEQPYVVTTNQKNPIHLKGHSQEAITVLISDSGKTAITIDYELNARVWNLTENPMGDWLDKSSSVVKPNWIANFGIESAKFERNKESKYKELLTQLFSIRGLNSPHSATEPKCGRTIVKFGGNENSALIGERDPLTYIGLVDLNKRTLMYSTPEADVSGEVFYFCSPEDGAAFAVEFADETRATEGI